MVQELSVSSGELNWELTSASSEEDLAAAEGSHHAAATALVGKLTPEKQPGPVQPPAQEGKNCPESQGEQRDSGITEMQGFEKE